MTDTPGHMWTLVQQWLDTFRYRPPSQRQIADRLGVSKSTLGDYKFGRTMPSPEFVAKLASEIQVPYERVLDAVLRDAGYRGEKLAAVEDQIADFIREQQPHPKGQKSSGHAETA